MGQKTVTINGMMYDKHTGMPLREERSHNAPQHHTAAQVHSQLQKSRTLNRKYVAKDHAGPVKRPAATHGVSVHKPATAPLVSRSESISRFAKEFNAAPRTQKRPFNDFGPSIHPIVANVEAKRAASVPAVPRHTPSSVLKNEAIDHALAQVKHTAQQKQVKPVKKTARTTRAISFASGSLALLLVGAYFTYLSMPSLSTRVAAAQAGINASYPNYKPTGYSLNGPVAFDQGSVSMKFAANAGPQSYTLSQTRSGWDSSAVLSNYVEPKTGNQYSTSTTNGLTIYTYGNKAAWVNAGILYTISGDAPLSSDQIQRIATSL
ncbi:hypothetical protein H7Y29_02345 [Microbacteriaceae bacterium]|nr:hypothetical protein [Candidatus Saccharibacteria bacterium]